MIKLKDLRGIIIEFREPSEMRYKTVGDYWMDKGMVLHICSVRFKDIRHVLLCTLHEFIESIKCLYDGVPEPTIKAFDVAFEKARKRGNTDEPGDDKKAPYGTQHCFSEGFERIFAAMLGVCWKEYEEICDSY
jgi:hypothetical protein